MIKIKTFVDTLLVFYDKKRVVITSQLVLMMMQTR